MFLCHHLFGFPEIAEIIIFVEANPIHVDPKLGEQGTFMRDSSTKFARRNFNVIVRICLLLQMKRTEINL